MDNTDIVEILMVEDDPDDAELALLALKAQNIVNNIVIVHDGVEALDFLFGKGKYEGRNLNHQPKLILLDLKMPKLDGLEVLKQLRTDDRTCAIPVVMLTSSKQDPDIKQAYELGVNSYIVKPVDFDQFAETVAKLGFYWALMNQSPLPSDEK